MVEEGKFLHSCLLLVQLQEVRLSYQADDQLSIQVCELCI